MWENPTTWYEEKDRKIADRHIRYERIVGTIVTRIGSMDLGPWLYPRLTSGSPSPYLVPDGCGGWKRRLEPPSRVNYVNRLSDSGNIASDNERLRSISGQMAKRVRANLDLGLPLSRHNWDDLFDQLEDMGIDTHI